MSFTKYGSIKTIHSTRVHRLKGKLIITEKIHGANFQICVRRVDGKLVIRFGKRNGFIAEDEDFFNHRAVMKKYEDNLSKLLEYLQTVEDFTEILIMGELYGGGYHGENIAGNKMIQKSKFANYHKENDFIVFDIILNGRWFTWDETVEFCQSRLQMNHVPEFARGSWEELKNFDIESQNSLLSRMHNGEDGKENPIEGVVVRMENPECTTPGEMDLRFKWKAREMSEGSYQDVKSDTPDTVLLMMTETRFQAYLSKVGDDEIIDGNMGKHIKEMVADVFVDIRDANPEIDEKVLKSYRGPLSGAARRLIFNYKNQV